MSLEAVTEKIKSKISMAPQISAKVKFDFGDDGIIFIDASDSNDIQISHEDEEADVTLKCKLETFEGLMNGTQDPNIAFMMGKLKVKGNMGLAMKLNSILED